MVRRETDALRCTDRGNADRRVDIAPAHRYASCDRRAVHGAAECATRETGIACEPHVFNKLQIGCLERRAGVWNERTRADGRPSPASLLEVRGATNVPPACDRSDDPGAGGPQGSCRPRRLSLRGRRSAFVRMDGRLPEVFGSPNPDG